MALFNRIRSPPALARAKSTGILLWASGSLREIRFSYLVIELAFGIIGTQSLLTVWETELTPTPRSKLS